MKKRNLLVFVMFIAFTGIVFITLNSFKQSAKVKAFGLQMYSIRDSIGKDVPRALAKISKMGYKYVEPAGYGDGKFYGVEAATFKTLCKANNLIMISSHTGRNAPDSSNYDETMKWWDACIDAHIAAGAKYIIQASMGRPALQSLKGLKSYCEYFNEVGAKCKAKGVRFGYHNHTREFTVKFDGQPAYDYLVANTDPSKVTFELDLGWAVEAGVNPVDYFNKYPGRFELWHIKDKEEVGASGTMDFKSIWANATISGMKFGIVEVEKYNFDQYTSCKKSLDFLNAASYVVMPK